MESEQRKLSASRVPQYLLSPARVRLHLRLRSTVYGLLFSPSRLSIARSKSDRLPDCLAYSLLQSTSTSRKPHWRLRLSCYQPITDQVEEGQRKGKGKARQGNEKQSKAEEEIRAQLLSLSLSLIITVAINFDSDSDISRNS